MAQRVLEAFVPAVYFFRGALFSFPFFLFRQWCVSQVLTSKTSPESDPSYCSQIAKEQEDRPLIHHQKENYFTEIRSCPAWVSQLTRQMLYRHYSSPIVSRCCRRQLKRPLHFQRNISISYRELPENVRLSVETTRSGGQAYYDVLVMWPGRYRVLPPQQALRLLRLERKPNCQWTFFQPTLL